MNMKTIKLTISGKVQGVFYRASAKKEAEKFGLKGWVRNTDTGSVEIMVTGDDADLQKFVGWCKKGPARSEVSNVDVQGAPLAQFPDFSVLR